MKKEYWNVFDRAAPVFCAAGTATIPADDCRAADGYWKPIEAQLA